MSPKERVAGFIRFFTAKGRQDVPRQKTLEEFSPEEIVRLIQLLAGRDVHDLQAYINIYRAASKELTVDDIQQARSLILVKEVLES